MFFLSNELMLLVCAILPVLAAPTSPVSSTYDCTDLMISVPVTNVTTLIPPFPYPFPNGYAATGFASILMSTSSSASKPKSTQLTTVFNISVEYCTPKTPGPSSSTIHFLTHGLGFDKSYWNFQLPNSYNATYSYIDSALSAGYSTLSWDRLGCGGSTIADPYTEVQATVELTLLAELTKLLREGSLSSKISKPQQVIHVGHSWGSQLSNALVAKWPELSDGVVLTGYSHLLQFQPLFLASTNLHLASTNAPCRFDDRSSGYLTWGDENSNQYSFLLYPYFDPAVLKYAESVKMPFTVGEVISQTLISYEAPMFKGPVLYLAAQYDLIYCGGACRGLLNSTSDAVKAFNSSKSIEVYVQPNVGHGINLHRNATAAFDVILDWTKRYGF